MSDLASSLSPVELRFLKVFTQFLDETGETNGRTDDVISRCHAQRISAPFVPGIIKSLVDKKIITTLQGQSSSYIYINSDKSLELYYMAEQLGWMPFDIEVNSVDEQSNATSEFGSAPASDRFVTLDHNSKALQDTIKALENLENVVMISNDLSVSSEDRLAISRELNFFKVYLDSASVRLSTIWGAIQKSSTLGWLREQSSSVAVQTAAGLAVLAIAKLFGF